MTELRPARKSKTPTPGQWWNIRYIESNLPVRFSGTTAEEAKDFIKKNIGLAISQKKYSQIRYF